MSMPARPGAAADSGPLSPETISGAPVKVEKRAEAPGAVRRSSSSPRRITWTRAVSSAGVGGLRGTAAVCASTAFRLRLPLTRASKLPAVAASLPAAAAPWGTASSASRAAPIRENDKVLAEAVLLLLMRDPPRGKGDNGVLKQG